MSLNDETYPRVGFAEHMRTLRWEQGEHLMICAGTGRGKSSLVRPLVDKRSHVVTLVSKYKDPTFEREYSSWERYKTWPKNGPKPWHNRIALWPSPEKHMGDTVKKQREIFLECMEWVNREGNRCIIFDEALVMSMPKYHNLGKEIGMMHVFGRSNGVSAVTLMQRPKWVPLEIMSNVSHAYFTGTTVKDDLARLKDMASGDPGEIGRVLMALPSKFDYAYLNPTGNAPGVIVNSRK